MALIADGYTNYRVALARGIAEETVKEHVKTILQKLDARNRTHAVALAIRAGYL